MFVKTQRSWLMPEPKLRFEPHPPKRSSGYLVEVAYKSVNQVNWVNQLRLQDPLPYREPPHHLFFF